MRILVINRSKNRKPDFWMLCKEEFTEAEVRPYRGVMRRNRIKFLPLNANCRWKNLYTKSALLEKLAQIKEAERVPSALEAHA